MNELQIKDQDIANTLGIHTTKLNSHADKIGLKEPEHYRVLNSSQPIRLYLISGLKIIYEHLHNNNNRAAAILLKRFLFSKRDQHIEAQVNQVIIQNTQSLQVFNGLSFISEDETIKILKTTKKHFDKILEYVKAKNTLRIDLHFKLLNDEHWFSPAGIYIIADTYSSLLTDSNRKIWCDKVSFTSQGLLPRLAAYTPQRLIPLAKKQALSRDKQTCQITGVKGINQQANLVVHHLYNIKHYPQLADSLDNLITLTADIHDEFHQWMGGTSVPCTVDDLIRFVVQLYPEKTQVLIKLNRFRVRLYAPYAPVPIK